MEREVCNVYLRQVKKELINMKFLPMANLQDIIFPIIIPCPLNEWVTLPDHKPFNPEDDISKKIKPGNKEKSNISFFQVTTEEGITMDGWVVKPNRF